MDTKPTFTEEEIEELCDLYDNFANQRGHYEIMQFLKEKFGWSNVHNVICELRKFTQEEHTKRQTRFKEKYKNSTLHVKLSARLDWTDKQRKTHIDE